MDAKISGFTLIELLATVVILLVLAALVHAGTKTVMDRAKAVQCVANLRTIAAGTITMVSERNGMLWSREEAGYSSYRQYEDPLGVPKMLEDYVPNKKVWLCPGGRSSLNIFENNYVWTVASQYDTKPALVVNSAIKTVLFWDNYRFTLPSVKGAPDANAPSIGPKSPGTRYERIPHHNGTKSNWAFLDGHVITGKTAAQ